MMVTIKGKYWYIVLFLFLSWGTSFAQTPSYIHFEPGIDIPFSTTYGDIIQDSLGYIWFGTDSGLYRYDGNFFKKTLMSSRIQDVEILDLMQAKNGTLWYRSINGQLCYFSNQTDSISVYNPNSFFDTLFVFSFKMQNDRIYIESKNQKLFTTWLHQIKSEKTESTEIKTIIKSNKLFAYSYSDGTLILPARTAQVKNLSNQTIKKSPAIKGDAFTYLNNNTNIIAIYSDLAVYSYSKENLISKKNNLDSFSINNWYSYNDEIWFLTNKGGFKVDSNFIKIESSVTLKGYDIFSALIDREGGRWWGTNGNGLFYFPPSIVKHFKAHPLLLKSRIQKIQKIPNGPYIIAADKNLILLDKKNLTPISSPKILSGRIFDIYVEKGMVFVKTSKKNYTYTYTPQSHKLVLINEKIQEGKIIVPLDTQNFIVGSYLFLKQVSGSGTINLSTEGISAIYKDTISSSIWVGGFNGVNIWKYNSSTIDKHPRKLKNTTNYITMISGDSDNHIWLSTTSGRLIEYANDSILSYSLEINRKPKPISLISCNTPDKIWLSNYNELYYFDKETKQFNSSYNIKDIIKSPIISLFDNNDTLLVGTKKGLFLYFPNLSKNPPPPLVGIESIKVNFIDTIIQPIYNLSYTQNNIEIVFNTIGSFAPLNKAKIYYKINKNDQWHLTNNKQIMLTNLAPSSYQIIAKSVYQENQTVFNTTTIRINIEKPFWKTIWFNLIVISGSTLLTFFWFYRKKRRIELEKDREKESERLKNAVLQLQMNPHFIFNSMNTIIYYITVANKEKSIQILTKMSRLIRQIFNFSSKNLVLLSTELRFLSDYLDMEQERFSEKVQIIKTIEQAAYTSNFKIPPLMVQPILENSFKHGLFHKKENGTLLFSVSLSQYAVKFVIEDNGVGRTKKSLPDKKLSSYDVINSRIKLINESKGEFKDVYASFSIEDLFDDFENPIGTRSVLTFKKETR